MGSPYKHFSSTKLKKLSKEQMSALRKELQRHIKEDPGSARNVRVLN
jgi:cytochrome c-type biogenesis protein CcmH/NrfG